VDFSVNAGTKWGQISFEQNSTVFTDAEATSVPLSVGGLGAAASLGGGYGGGMMGGGMMGGGMMGGMGGQQTAMQAQSLKQLIQESIDPESWFELNDLSDGTVTPYPIQQPKRLSVYNTHEVHEEIDKLLDALRKGLGHQVSIEARFLVVTESFLEDIGLDVAWISRLTPELNGAKYPSSRTLLSSLTRRPRRSR